MSQFNALNALVACSNSTIERLLEKTGSIICTLRARGHMDCTELVRDRAVARAEPIVNVEHSLAKVTHEAAVGTVDQKQLETLMAHGLTPEQAVDVIIMGLLR